MTSSRALRATTAGLLAASVAWSGWLAPASADPAEQTTADKPDAAARVVARVDVDGDRRRDDVRYAVLRDSLVKVTVTTASGRTRSRKLNTQYWPRGHWHGATALDGRPGQELVIGTQLGAHTPAFTVLTWRDGRLVREHAPGRQHLWVVDAYYNGYSGWLRTRSNGRVRMAARYVTRDYHGDNRHWTGKVTTFTWRAGRWVRTSSHPLSIRGNSHQASRVGGWQVSGLKRWPW